MKEIAQRAIACKHWRWMTGMAVFNPDMPTIGYQRIGDDCVPRYPFLLPDLSDPTTLGCLRFLAEKAHGTFDIVIQIHAQPRMEGVYGWWRAFDSRGRRLPGAGTFVSPNGASLKAYALVAALEAAQ